MKVIALTTAAFMFAGSAFAGSMTFEEPAEPEVIVEEDAGMGSSGGWILPLVALGVIVAIVASNN
ncbi:MAG: hypothetical protein ACE5FS_10360 [Paracoccaceae bacterium]